MRRKIGFSEPNDLVGGEESVALTARHFDKNAVLEQFVDVQRRRARSNIQNFRGLGDREHRLLENGIQQT